MKKIKTLSERGVGGEKESAEKLLLQLMEKYKITEDEISEDSVDFEWFRYKDNIQKRLLRMELFHFGNKVNRPQLRQDKQLILKSWPT